jgi:hypothetical protein
MPKSKKHVSTKLSRHPELVRESEWLRVYRTNQNVLVEKSRFLEDGLVLKASELGKMWDTLSPQQKHDLCIAYHAKVEISKDDEKILNIIMEKGNEFTWSHIASVLTRHPDRERIAAFFISRIERQSPPLSNFFQAVETLGDSRLVPHLLKRYNQYRESGVSPKNKDRVLTIDYLTCCRTLGKLTGSRQYEREITEYIHAEDKLVRDTAKRLLE